MLVCARLAWRAQRTCRADRATDSGQSILPTGLSLDDDEDDGLTLLPEGHALSPALDCFPRIQSRGVLACPGSSGLLSQVQSDCFTSGQTPPMTVTPIPPDMKLPAGEGYHRRDVTSIGGGGLWPAELGK